MRKKKLLYGLTAVLTMAALCGCSTGSTTPETSAVPTTAAEPKVEEEDSAAVKEQTTPDIEAADDQPIKEEKEEYEMKDPVLLYMGHASLRIVTGEDKVIYIDPFAGSGYDMTADLILQTHDHFDHKDMSKISSKSSDCVVITQKEALSGGIHNSFDQGYVKVEAVEAGYNKNHDKKNCVGYILTFSNGATLYVSGDTSKTEQMPELAARNLDYAFFCCDGVFSNGFNGRSPGFSESLKLSSAVNLMRMIFSLTA